MTRAGGALLFSASAILLMGILTAETFYPNYNVKDLMISTLGSYAPGQHTVHEPAGSIFNSSMKIAGLLLTLGAYFLYKIKNFKRVGVLLMLSGTGLFIIGFVPAYHHVPHNLAALTTFLTGGTAAIATSLLLKSPLKYIVFVTGSIALIFLFLGIVTPGLILPHLGTGGTERWVAYPIILYLAVFGGYLMGKDKKNN